MYSPRLEQSLELQQRRLVGQFDPAEEQAVTEATRTNPDGGGQIEQMNLVVHVEHHVLASAQI